MRRERVLLLLDRDGTLTADPGYPNDPAAVKLLPGAAAAVLTLAAAGYVPAVVSNQSGVARGKITPAQAAAVHARFVQLVFAETGLKLPAYYCPHAPEDCCECRKPKTGLLDQAAADLGLTAAAKVMVGDKPSDVAAGIAVGARTVWLAFGQHYPAGEPAPDIIVNDISELPAALKARPERGAA